MDTYLDYAQAIREEMKYDLCRSVDDFNVECIIRRYEEMRKEREKGCYHPYVFGGRLGKTYCIRCGEMVEELMGG